MNAEKEFVLLGARPRLRAGAVRAGAVRDGAVRDGAGRDDAGRDDAGRMNALLRGAGFDWRSALGHAAFHGVLPLVGRNLERLEVEAIPADVLESVRAHLRENAAGNLRKMGELVRVTRMFADHGIDTLHFKGPVLAAHAFRNLALRDFVDLDILVREADVRRARELLLASGYEPTLSPAGEALHVRRSYWLGFAHPSAPFKIDLHWKLADPFFHYEPDLPTLWANAQTLRIGGAAVRTFSAEDSVLALSAHGFKHGYSRLKWVCDLCEWIRVHPDLDWARVQAVASGLHVARILGVSVSLVHEFDDAVVPEGVVRAAREDRGTGPLVRRVWDRIFGDAKPLEGWRGDWFHARGRERRVDGLRYLWLQCVRRFKRLVVPNELDRSWVPLPSFLGFVHYALRPVRLVVKALAGKPRDPVG